jgi:hypothetical protein
LFVEITGAERYPGQDQCSRRGKRHRIERRGGQGNNPIFIGPRGPANVTATAWRAQSPGEALEPRR